MSITGQVDCSSCTFIALLLLNVREKGLALLPKIRNSELVSVVIV